MKKYYRHNDRQRNEDKKGRFRTGLSNVLVTVLACLLLITTGIVIAKSGLTDEIFFKNHLEKKENSSGTASVSQELLKQLDRVSIPAKSSPAAVSPMKLEDVDCSYIVIDRMSGEVLLARNQDGFLYPSSTTKILTAALAMEMVPDLNTPMTVSYYMYSLIGSEASKMGLLSGEELPFHALLYGLMLPSGCDAANVIAENAAGNYYAFVNAMNKKAADIGCQRSYFVNPSGLYGANHFSTVSDLARIEAYAERNDIYRDIISTEEYTFAPTNMHPYEGWSIVSNSNTLLHRDYLFDSGNIVEINGSKTGTTVQGGYSLVCSAVTSQGAELIAVVAGIPYNNGQGRYLRDSYMLSVLDNGAKIANQKIGTAIVACGEQKEETERLSEILPRNGKIITKRGFIFSEQTENDLMLTPGETNVFYAPSDFSVKYYYYTDLESRLSKADQEEQEIGYIELTAADGSHPVNHIPLYCKVQQKE